MEYTVKINEFGTKFWYKNGRRHREDGPAVEFADGAKEWYKDGKLHREDGPAIEWANGTKVWYKNHRVHREDGPAVESANGDKYWYLNGIKVTEEEVMGKPQNVIYRLVEEDILSRGIGLIGDKKTVMYFDGLMKAKTYAEGLAKKYTQDVVDWHNQPELDAGFWWTQDLVWVKYYIFKEIVH